ncbi:MAG: D-glycero-beta-D-manno-heptose 1-phosphate adenylyltransferase [Acidobacteriia bacterium]|nr:D-glycero-beta-D-manno-heptose 1-phosphate adenylyltransferase [Terriglobia bacterium]
MCCPRGHAAGGRCRARAARRAKKCLRRGRIPPSERFRCARGARYGAGAVRRRPATAARQRSARGERVSRCASEGRLSACYHEREGTARRRAASAGGLGFAERHVDGAILTIEEAIVQFGRGKRNGRVVFTNGCFDILHPGHVRTLEQARALGDYLIVGINSDASVGRLKGAGRPLIAERERAEILAAFESVDAVVIFEEETPQAVIARLLPDILVKGGDWGADQIVGRAEVEAAGGQVVLTPVVAGYSTTEILRKAREGAAGSPC